MGFGGLLHFEKWTMENCQCWSLHEDSEIIDVSG